MKRILFVCLLFSGLKCNAQKGTIWLPEQYVMRILQNDSQANEFLIPIESFINPFKNCLILTHKGEWNKIKTKKISIHGVNKHELLNLSYYINLKYHSWDLVRKIERSDIYISMEREKLLLEIVHEGIMKKTYFIDRVNGFQFKGIDEVMKYLASHKK